MTTLSAIAIPNTFVIVDGRCFSKRIQLRITASSHVQTIQA